MKQSTNNFIAKISNLNKLNKLHQNSKNNYFWSIFALSFCLSYIVSIFSQWINSVLASDQVLNPINNLLDYSPENSGTYLFWYVAYAILITPIMEELAFRFLLSDNSHKQNVGMSLMATFFLSLFSIEYTFLALFAIIPYLLFYVYWGWKNPSPITLYKVNWPTILIFALIFMVAHYYVPNSPINNWKELISIPVSVLYLFVNAIALSLIRVRINLFSGIKLHSLYNCLAFLPSFIAMIVQSNRFNTDYKNLIFGIIFAICFAFIFSKYFCHYQLTENQV